MDTIRCIDSIPILIYKRSLCTNKKKTVKNRFHIDSLKSTNTHTVDAAFKLIHLFYVGDLLVRFDKKFLKIVPKM